MLKFVAIFLNFCYLLKKETVMDLFDKINKTQIYDVVKDKGIYPYFHQIYSGQDVVVNMEGRRTIMLGSNNYLALTSHPEVKKAGIEALEKYGSGCSGSRFLNGTLDLHIKFENELAEFLHQEAAMTFGTGFQSNLGAISALVGRNDYVICDKENHASIYDACKLSYGKMLRYKHNDMEDLERKLASVPKESGILIVTDGVFSMSGDICNLPVISKLAKKFNARVMVDDAHGLGVLGKHGRGTGEYFDMEDDIDIYMGTFSKSLASLGGYVAGKKDVIEYLKHNSRPYIFSASMTPANVACANKALDILKAEPQRVARLRHNSDYMRKGLKNNGINIIDSTTPIIPIYTYQDDKTFIACKMLLERGVYVNPVISPATPVGQSLLRTSYTADHTEDLLDEAIDKIKEVLTILNNYGKE